MRFPNTATWREISFVATNGYIVGRSASQLLDDMHAAKIKVWKLT